MKLTPSETTFLSKKLNSYKDFSPQHLDEIIAGFESRSYPKGQYLLKAGNICDFWGFIYQGLIRSYSLKDDDEEYTIGCITEENFITESLSFFKRLPSSVNVHALEDTTLLCISYQRLQQLFTNIPGFDAFARKLYEDRLATIKSRLLFRIQLNATDRYCYLLQQQPELIKRVPLKYIASYLGITDSTLSRIRRKIGHMKS